jgi:hypothetical protein
MLKYNANAEPTLRVPPVERPVDREQRSHRTG